MVLADLGRQLTASIASINEESPFDEDARNALVKEVSNALIRSDVNTRLVMSLRKNLKSAIQLEKVASSSNKRRIVMDAVVTELVNLLNPGVTPFKPVRNKCSILMFVGLQGSGKTTTCTKLAYHYKKRGWKSAVVCADTFRAGAFDQVRQNCLKANVHFYGSKTETDPTVIAAEGVAKFKEQGFDLIIVDTSGRHMQETALFEEMKSVERAVKPDDVIFVMDSSIGQAAEDQAQAFKDAVKVGSVVITKMDGHARGGGALSAVAATGSPISFIGTGEHLEDIESFRAEGFVRKLLNLSDIHGMMEKMQDMAETNQGGQQAMFENLAEGNFTFRDFQTMMSPTGVMGSATEMMKMIPGMGGMMQGMDGMQDTIQMMTKRMGVIFSSMTEAELDMQAEGLSKSRMQRISRGSGARPEEIKGMIKQMKMYHNMFTKGPMKNLISMRSSMGAAAGAGGATGTPKKRKGRGGKNAGRRGGSVQQQAGMPPGIPPGGMGGMADMMKNLMGGAGGAPGGMGGMADMMKGLMGGGGAGGMGGMAEMMKNPQIMKMAQQMGMGGGMPSMS